MAKILTQVAIDTAKPGGSRRELPDGKVTGLYLVVQPSGSKSWALRFRADGRPRKLTIGQYPQIGLADARKSAQAALGEVARGNDPCVQKCAAKAAARTEKLAELDIVEKIVDEFVARYAKPNTRDWKETQRLLRKDVVGAWQGRRLSEIGKADVHRLLDKMVDRGAAVSANQLFAHFRKMCRWAVSRGIIDKNPCEGISPPTAEKPRDRVLDERELALVWRAAEALGFPYGAIVQLLILTGARKGEVSGAAWRELDLQKRLWMLPALRSKNAREHQIPLSAPVLDILADLPRFEKSDLAFSASGRPPASFSDAKTRLDAEIARLNDGKPLPSWTLHDLRRSVASGMASIGVDLHVIERVLNHVSGSFGGIVSVYQRHSYADEMRDALDRWARHVERVVGGEGERKGVEFSAARAAP